MNDRSSPPSHAADGVPVRRERVNSAWRRAHSFYGRPSIDVRF